MQITLEGKVYDLDIDQAKKLNLLKEKDTRCKSWEEFKLKYKSDKGYYYDFTSNEIYNPISPCGVGDQLTQQDAIAIQAFSKLLKLRRDWIGDWNPDWREKEPKYCIITVYDHLKVAKFYTDHHVFAFPTKEMAEEFLECFKELFKQGTF